MKISRAFDDFEAALKALRAAEIAALGAQGAQRREAAADLKTRVAGVEAASLHLWSLPARGPSDLVLKARALRWHFPDGVEIGPALRLGADDPSTDADLGAIATHYIVRDLLALAERRRAQSPPQSGSRLFAKGANSMF